MLRSAAVEGHRRSACRRAAIGVILVAATGAITAQTPPADFLTEIVARVVAVVPAGSPLSIRASDPEDPALGPALSSALAARGYRIGTSGTTAGLVTVDCGRNLRERVCALTIRGEAPPPTRAVFTRPRSAPTAKESPALSLQLRPLLSQAERILDVQITGDRLVALDSTGVALYDRAVSGWRRVGFAPTPGARPWPRDLRGRLRLAGDRLEAFLPGTVCTGTLALTDVRCRDARVPWPLAIDNTGLDPQRNVFSTPEGISFFAAVALGTNDTPRWLVAAENGVLTFLDGARRAIDTAGAGDELAALVDPCRSRPYVVIRRPAPAGSNDSLALVSAPGPNLPAAAAPLALSGRLTALWADPSGSHAGVVVYSAGSDQYEAFDLRIACTG
jgi:hypothetical protein